MMCACSSTTERANAHVSEKRSYRSSQYWPKPPRSGRRGECARHAFESSALAHRLDVGGDVKLGPRACPDGIDRFPLGQFEQDKALSIGLHIKDALIGDDHGHHAPSREG
mmetsp:Transcript_36654/g.49707  ORF Transcript_36654/g.49707 Transcript_36654/m.49707 type:complete len:110 (-) Transcript_36654:73-402(-)|eukprot:scaffold205736_cov32-Tisochrysis_lutea.AAC.6